MYKDTEKESCVKYPRADGVKEAASTAAQSHELLSFPHWINSLLLQVFLAIRLSPPISSCDFQTSLGCTLRRSLSKKEFNKVVFHSLSLILFFGFLVCF
jgi:hypothetical protein